MKNKRTVRSWEPDPDVDAMLDMAKKAGLAIGKIVNEAMRHHGPKVIRKLRDEQRDRLASLTFDQPDLPLDGLMSAA